MQKMNAEKYELKVRLDGLRIRLAGLQPTDVEDTQRILDEVIEVAIEILTLPT